MTTPTPTSSQSGAAPAAVKAAPAAAKAAPAKAAAAPAKPAARKPAPRKPAASPAPKRKFSLKPRLLPVTIFAVVLLLGARVGDFWTALATGGPLPGVTPVVADAGVAELVPPTRPEGAEVTAAQPQRPLAAQSVGTSSVGTSSVGVPSRPPVQVAEATPPAQAPNPTPAPATSPSAPAAPGTGTDRTFTPNEVEILQRLQERREQLDERSRQLDQREALVQVAEQRLDQKVAELESLKAEIATLLVQVNEQEQARLDSLVKIYETMKPKEAAAVFEGLDKDVLMAVIGRMRESKLAPIFGAMTPQKAAEITALRAQRSNLPTLPQ
ncbi:MAG: putative flagellin protein FlaA [Pseudomonadota bacterium]|jgi:flagellar motility protein MotE (MotC chaperone)